jgi:hypothetical protein
MTDVTVPHQRDHVVTDLLAAMVRILSGRPTRAQPGDLTITAVAVESGLKRHYLTHKHTELKELFYQLRDHHDNPVKHDAAELKSQIDDLNRRLSDANSDRRKWKSTAETFARAIQVLTLEIDQLKDGAPDGDAAAGRNRPSPIIGFQELTNSSKAQRSKNRARVSDP